MTPSIPRLAILPAGILLLLSGCADQPTTPAAMPTDDAAAARTSSGPVTQSASGSGHFHDGSRRRTFTFSARGHLDGSADGSFHVVIDGPGRPFTVRGQVTCVRVIGNEAWIGGRDEYDRSVAFRVVDGGEGAGAADKISYVHYNPGYGEGWGERNCASALTLPLRPIAAGNVDVRGERVELTTVYENDFESPVGGEWSTTGRATSPSGQTFLGEFSGEQPHGPTLSLTGLPSHRYVRVQLDFYAIRTLDGSGPAYGPDLITFGESVSGFSFTTTFAATGGTQAFPGRYPDAEHTNFAGASGIRTLGFIWNGQDGPVPFDATYPVELTFAHTGGDLELSVIGEGLQAFIDGNGLFADESWGIDNVRVQVLR